jgi:hypothetical protein
VGMMTENLGISVLDVERISNRLGGWL